MTIYNSLMLNIDDNILAEVSIECNLSIDIFIEEDLLEDENCNEEDVH